MIEGLSRGVRIRKGYNEYDLQIGGSVKAINGEMVLMFTKKVNQEFRASLEGMAGSGK